jgi:hypothetical protein
MFQNQSKKNVFLKRSDLTFEAIILARQLKTLLNSNLHRRRVKSTSREILEIVCRLYFDITSNQSSRRRKARSEQLKNLTTVKNDFHSTE